MIVKNISGETRYFGFGRPTNVRGRTLLDQDTLTLPDNDPVVLAAVQNFVAEGVLSISSGPSNNALLASTDRPAQGYVAVNSSISNTNTVTIAGQVFEFAVDPGSAVLGKYNANLSNLANVWAGAGAAAATAVATLRTAILALAATTGVTAGASVQYVSGKYLLPLRRKDGGISYTGLTLAKSGSNLAVSDTQLAPGVQGPGRRTEFITRTVTAGDVTFAAIVIATGLASVSNYLIQVRTAGGVVKAWDGAVTINGGDLTVDISGSTDWADTDVISIFVQE